MSKVFGMTRTGTLRQIWRYPVSSFAGERLDVADVTARGISGDRRGAFFEKDTGNIVFPSVVRKWNVAPQMAARTSASGEIEISVDGTTWRRLVDPQLSGDLASFGGTEIVFHAYGDAMPGGVAKQRYAWQPLHLLSLQALAALRTLLPDSLIDLRRFRPNMLVDLPHFGGPVPEYELIGREFTVGGVRLRGLRPSGRCSFTTLAQNGLPEDRAVLRALIRNFEKNFGIYCEVLEPGRITAGDAIDLTPVQQIQRPIVIVGAGQAGTMTAKALRDLGCSQTIQIFGDERHAPYERPPLSKPESALGLSPVVPLRQVEEMDLDLHLNSPVVSVHRSAQEVEMVDGARHPYDRLVLATGGSARRLPGVERGHGRIHAIRTADDAVRLYGELHPGTRLAVLGGGWLGLEIAATARKLSCEVTLWARQDRVLTRAVPAVVADYVASRHVGEGVVLRLGEMPGVREHSDGVELTGKSGKETFDHLVVAIGITPNDYLARQAGIAVDDGVLTDAAGATSDPHVFAVGDVARRRTTDGSGSMRVESWHNANDQAAVVARAILSRPQQKVPVARFWSSQYDMMIQIAGLPDPAATLVRSELGDTPFWDFGGFAVAINRPRDIHRYAASLAESGDAVAAPTRITPDEPAVSGVSSRVRIGSIEEFPAGSLRQIEVSSLGKLLVVEQGGVFFATDDQCPHAAASLSEGFVERGRIVCPVHFAEFDLRTGEAHSAPAGCGRLRCYGVERSGDDLFVVF